MARYGDSFGSTLPDREQAYRETVQTAKEQLYNYYGTASQYFPAAQADLIRVQRMTPEEIVTEARRKRLI